MSGVDTSVAASLATKTSTFGTVNVRDLVVDPRFQRSIKHSSVAKIKEHFHPAGVGALLVAKVNGGNGNYAIIDGQTRMRAMSELETCDGSAKAEIFEHLTVAEAALLFRMRNNQYLVPQKERDRIAVTEGDPVMTEVAAQIAETDYVAFSDDPANITMPCMSAAKMIIRWGMKKQFPGLLTRSLVIQDHAFRPPEGSLDGTVDATILAATAELILHNDNLDDDHLVSTMENMGLPLLQSAIKKRAELLGSRLKSAAKTELVEKYNKVKKGADKITR